MDFLDGVFANIGILAGPALLTLGLSGIVWLMARLEGEPMTMWQAVAGWFK